MKKQIGKLVLLALLTLCFVASVCVLVACDPETPPTPDNNDVDYTVTVMQDATTPAVGVKVKINKGSATLGEPKATDADGKADFTLASDNYTVALSNLPAGYSLPSNTKLALTADNPSLTIVLEKDFVYTVKLVNPDNTPYYAEGVTVGVCTIVAEGTGNCLAPVELGQDGVAVIKADKGDYHVQVLGLPLTATIEVDAQGYYAGENFSATETEMSITVYNITIANGKVERKIAAGETAYFVINPTIEGYYTVSHKDSLIYLQNGGELVLDENGHGLYGSVYCKLDIPYYFKTTNDGKNAVTAKIEVSAPVSSYVEQEGKAVDVSLTVGKADVPAIIAYYPEVAGKYTITVTGANAAISVGADTLDEITAEAPAANEYAKNATKDYYVLTSSVKNIVREHYIVVTVKADQYPANFSVKVEKTGNVQDKVTVKRVTETLTQYENAPEGKKLVGVPLSLSAVVLGDDGYYHYGKADGPVVVVMLTEAVTKDRFNESGNLVIAYAEKANPDYRVRYISYLENATGTGETIDDWQLLIRGFRTEDYGQEDGVITLPTDVTGEYYAKYTNDDGMYPLTQELREFLEDFTRINGELLNGKIPAVSKLDRDGAPWLFPCYYYADEQGNNDTPDAPDTPDNPVDVDPIVGVYVDDYSELQVNSDGTFIIYDIFDGAHNEMDTGAWSKVSEGNYTFTIPECKTNPDDMLGPMLDLDYTVTYDSATKTLTFVDGESTEYEFVLVEE